LPPIDRPEAVPLILVPTNTDGVPRAGATIVLFVSVSVVDWPTRVSVPVGIVNTDVPLSAEAFISQVPEVDPTSVKPPDVNVIPPDPSKIRLIATPLN
jgi:hypothetical protein